MEENNLPALHISYFGFERKIQQQLEQHLSANAKKLKQLPVFVNDVPCSAHFQNIHICFFTGICNSYAQRLEHSKTNNARVLCVGQFSDFGALLSCVQTGCYGCISVTNMFEEIIPAIICVLENKIFISPELAPVVNHYFRGNKAYYSNLFTTRENKLIQLLAKGALYKEIAWKLQISENTVRSHVRNIYSKMKVHSKTELAQKILSTIFNFHLFISFQNI